MREFDQAIIDQMVSIGFRHHCTDSDNGATIYEYKYKPEYLNGKYYHLVIYDYHMTSLSSDHQLNIHDPHHRKLKIVYQISTQSEWGRNTLTDLINDIFKSEIRIVTLNNIINV